MPNDRVDIKRPFSDRDVSSWSSNRRRRFPEKFIDRSRRVSVCGVVNADNGASMSSRLANVVAQKACVLEIILQNIETQELSPPFLMQAGLIRGGRLNDP